MQKLFNYRVLRLIPVVFLIFIVIRIYIDYNNTLEREYNFVKKEAQVLNTYAVTHRNYYQQLFINKTLILNQKTISALPAYSSTFISDIFSKKNKFNIQLHTVSDRARNPKNSADKEEMKAISFFRKNKNKKEYFKENSDFYQYATVLRIQKKCLLCHKNRKNAPKYIRNKYSTAYNYKLGEVRGIMSIKIPKQTIHSYFLRGYKESVVYDIILLILLFLGISYITHRSKLINLLLEEEVHKKTDELNTIFTTDKLTKLPNRNKLIDDISKLKNFDFVHLAFVNIDKFKDINDFYGYDTGDKILCELSLVLKENCLCESSSVYKLPSDEFAFFSAFGMSELEFFNAVRHTIQIVSKKQFDSKCNGIFISLSCGIASNKEQLMRKADMALRLAKEKNKHIVVYDNTLDISEKIIANTKKTAILRKAIEEDGIVPYFQPIYNLHTQKIEKYECLVRIVQKDGNIVLPYEFLDIAIKSKQYFNITRNMITKSLELFKDKEYECSINLAVDDILNADIVAFIKQSIKNFPNPEKIVFEILEYDEIKNYDEIKKFIEQIHALGCKFAIDDFGSGYSNFTHIYELNIDFIKIDASLIKNIYNDKKSQIITKAIIDFASSLNIITIAEFVEDKKSLELLRKLGVDFIQGYYIGKPSDKII